MDDVDRGYMNMTFGRDFPPAPPEEDMATSGARDRTVLSTFPSNPKSPRAAGAQNAPMTAGDAGTVVMDTLAGLVKGAVAQVLGLPGDVESLVRLITEGDQKLLTTSEFQKLLPQLIPEGAPADPRRLQAARMSEQVGELLPLPSAAGAAVKVAKRIKIGANGKRLAAEPAR